MHMMNKKVFSWKTVLVLISLLAALALAASAKDSKRLAQENPAPSPYAKENTAEIESHLTKAKNYFEKAEFSYAEMFYDMALRLDKDNAAIKARIEDTRQYRARQKELLDAAPKGDKRNEYLNTKYKTAVQLFKDKKYPEAYKEFEEIWLIVPNGEFKATKKYMSNTREKLDQAEAKPAAPKTPAVPTDKEAAKAQKEKINALIKESEALLKKDNFDAAAAKNAEALAIDKDNKDALKLKANIEKKKANALAKAEAQQKKIAEVEKKREEEAARQKALAEQKQKEADLKKIKEAEEKEKKEAERLRKSAAERAAKLKEKEEEAKKTAEKPTPAQVEETKQKAQKEAEEARLKSEQEAQQKKAADELKKKEEDARLKAEKEKKEIEEKLKLEQQKKQEAEAALKKAEELKKQEAEKIKKEAETKTAEQLKKEKEAEEARLKAEKEKKDAEAKAADDQKKKEEEARIKAEKEKADKEKKDAEAKKIAEEQRKKDEENQIKKLQEEKLNKAKALVADAQKALDKGNLDEAIKKADEALKIEPLFAEATTVKNAALEKKKKIEEADQAKKAKELAEKTKKEQISRALADGNALFNNNKYDDSTTKFQEVIRLDPANSEAKKMLDKLAQIKAQEKQKTIQGLILDGKSFLAQNRLDDSRKKFEEVLKYDVNNREAQTGLQEISRRRADAARRLEEEAKAKVAADAQKAFDEGLKAYEKKDIETAIACWQEALKIKPDHLKAKTYLEETQGEYDAFLKSKAEKDAFDKKEADAQAKMKTLISVSTTVPHTPLISFLDSLSIISGINFYVTSGVEATVDAKFVDTPLNEVLDTLLNPIGLKWSRKSGSDVVTITPDLQTKIFNLSSAEAAKVKAIIESGDIHRLLWGKDGTPKLKGVDLTLDDREGILVSVDSAPNIQKLEAFLHDLRTQAPPALEYRTYRLREGEGPKVKSLLEQILKADDSAPYSQDRKLLLDDRDLIVKDVAENIKKVEQILQEKDFIEKLRSDTLQLRTWPLAPREALKNNPDQLRQFGDWVVQVISVMLYAKSTRSKAEAEGRRLWWDQPNLLLTVVDYPDNILAVDDFINSLPQLEVKTKTAIIPLKYQRADVLAGKINSVFGLSGAGEEQAGGPSRGEMTVTKSVSDGKDFTWRDLYILVKKVNDNDVNNEKDDSVEFKARTPGETRDITMDEADSEVIDDYEIIVDDIKPSSTAGKGQVRFKIYYRPTSSQIQTVLTPVPTPAVKIADEEEAEAEVEAITESNSLYVPYKDPAHFERIKKFVERSDLPKKQISLETKFVEVIESRAREFSSQIAIADLTQGIDFDNSVLNMRYANDLDELQNALRSQYEPSAESPYFQHMMKGTTVFSLVTGGNSPLNWQLRMLEAEGIVNVVSGPQITFLEGESPTFRIERRFDPIGYAADNVNIPSLIPVDFSISDPFVSAAGYIEFNMNPIIEDLDAQFMSGAVTLENQQDVQQATNVPSFSRIRKDINTTVRVKDGGTAVVGGWTSERSGDYRSGIPILHNIPFIGSMLFGRNLRHIDKTTLLIFVTCRIVE